jgi:hypothetical protein
LEKEIARRRRDVRLHRKFAAATRSKEQTSTYNPVQVHNSLMTDDGDDVVVVDAEQSPDNNNNNNIQTVAKPADNHGHEDEDTMDATDGDDWQDVSVFRQSHDGSGYPHGSTNGSPSASGMLDDGETLNASANNSSFLGKLLAQQAVTVISNHNVRVKSPTAALAAAFHACLRSDTVGFVCTGVPEHHQNGTTSKKNSLAFAPPVRELPKTQFLPQSWETTPPNTPAIVSLRYRKNGTGALVLTVDATSSTADSVNNSNSVISENVTVNVHFAPANSKEPSPFSLSFSLDDHFNIDSWDAAKRSNSSSSSSSSSSAAAAEIAPSLHYKSLATMLTKFCQTFDLGVVMDDNDVAAAAGLFSGSSKKMKSDDPPGDSGASAIYVLHPPSDRPLTVTAQQVPSTLNKDGRVQFPNTTEEHKNRRNDNDDDPPTVDWKSGRTPSTLDQAFPATSNGGRLDPRGDFADDLLPAGLQDPRFAPAPGRGHGGRMGGNLMGPNHPIFSGDPTMIGPVGIHGPPIGGPGTMQPRFDPFYPPGIDGGGNGDLPFGAGPPDPLRHPVNKNMNRMNRPSLRGEPNPDHLPPPNSLGGGDHMFM